MSTFDDFQKLYPNLFREYPRSGFSAPTGWIPLLHSLCCVLEYAIGRMPEEERAGFQCAQSKEKFAGVRFYMTKQTDYMSGAIAMAEYMSERICEICGQPGECRKDGWWSTLCDKHHEEREKKRNTTGK